MAFAPRSSRRPVRADGADAAAFAFSPRLERRGAGRANARTCRLGAGDRVAQPGPAADNTLGGYCLAARGERLSLVGVLASVVGLLFLASRRRRGEETENPSHNSHLASSSSVLTLGAMVGCAFVLLVGRIALDRSSGGPFLWHSPPGQLAFAVEGQPVTLGDSSSQVKFLGWELMSGSTPKPGGTIRVRLYWQADGQISEKLFGFLHLYTPSLQRSWAVENIGVARTDSQCGNLTNIMWMICVSVFLLICRLYLIRWSLVWSPLPLAKGLLYPAHQTIYFT